MDSINVAKYVKELTSTMIELSKATGRMFDQEHLRIINMVSAINTVGSGGGGGGRGGGGGGRATKFSRGIMEHKVITNLK